MALTELASSNIRLFPHHASSTLRQRVLGHRGGVIWLTGLSAFGKSTLAMGLEKHLLEQGILAYSLDGDNIRHGLNSDLGFSPEDRAENIRRIGEVAALFAEAGMVCITAFISPYRADRALAKQAIGSGFFAEVYVKAELSLCEQRDPKGLYRKARAGQLNGMTGIDAPYEVPEAPDLILDTSVMTVEESISKLAGFCVSAISKG